MIQRLLSLPLIVILMGLGAIAMLFPATYGYLVRELHAARVFLYAGILLLTITSLIAIATANNPSRSVARSHLVALLSTYLVLPALLAIPFYETLQNTSFLNAYFEMVSSLTTTGATLFDEPGRLVSTLHLWRAIVGWMGGFFVWVMGIAVLAPLNLGGFEVTSRSRIGLTGTYYSQVEGGADPSKRLAKHAITLLPIYSGLTLALWIFLILAGESPFVAVCHAMSTLATSGISPIGGISNGNAGYVGEGLIFIFLFFAISRLTFAPETQSESMSRLSRDPEFRMGLFFIVMVPTLLFVRHWVGAYEVDDEENAIAALKALWGSAFTVLSFLSTAGFESGDWSEARGWSGLETPGLILVGLSLIGGGVATTAGGVKLLRVYALYKHGLREMDRLVHPSSVGGSGAEARHLRRQGAYMAWIFFMLFALSVAVVMVSLSLTGLTFETTIVLTVASLSTTGPLASVAAETPVAYGALGSGAKVILAGAMVVGRLETLAIIALLNPDLWRS